MKRLLTGFLAIIGFFVVVIALVAVMIFSVKSDKKTRQLPSQMVVTLNLDEGLKELRPQPGIFSTLSPSSPALQDIIQTLELARQDQRVKGIAVHLEEGVFDIAAVQELRDSITRFRKSGKFAHLYADTLGSAPATSEYWLATAFDQIWLHPMGEMALTGFGTEMPFAKGFLDKIGVEAEILHQGKYKSMPETVTRYSISRDNLEMTRSMLNDLQRQYDEDVIKTRSVTQDVLDATVQLGLVTASDALAMGLIDSIGYRDEFDSYLEQLTDGAKAIAFSDYQSNGPRPVPGEKIALVQVIGALTTTDAYNAAMDEAVSAEEIVAAIRDAADRHAIKAIIVRVDSPGGTPLAADMIRRSIELARMQKPVVVSMSNTAASGGYWMSVDANAIVAQPGTLTGSIGVFGGKLNLAGLWSKLGVRWDSVTTTERPSMWSSNRPYSPQARKIVEASMARTYDKFIALVSKGRKLTKEQTEKLAQGRVWTGAQAKENGLVDLLGGMDVAIDKARDLARISKLHPVNLEVFPKPLNPLEQIFTLLRQGGFPFPMAHIKAAFRAVMQDGLREVSTPKLVH